VLLKLWRSGGEVMAKWGSVREVEVVLKWARSGGDVLKWR